MAGEEPQYNANLSTADIVCTVSVVNLFFYPCSDVHTPSVYKLWVVQSDVQSTLLSM